MEYRNLGRSGLKVSALTLGTMTYGGRGNFAKVGSGGVKDLARAIDLCADHGVNLIDTADIYSFGALRGVDRRGDRRQAERTAC